MPPAEGEPGVAERSGELVESGKSDTEIASVATGIGLTAPSIPMLFMGQEFLEDKQWSDNFEFRQNLLLHWAGLGAGDKQMLDHVQFTRELTEPRWRYPGLRN